MTFSNTQLGFGNIRDGPLDGLHGDKDLLAMRAFLADSKNCYSWFDGGQMMYREFKASKVELRRDLADYDLQRSISVMAKRKSRYCSVRTLAHTRES